MRQTLTYDFWGLDKNMNCMFPLKLFSCNWHTDILTYYYIIWQCSVFKYNTSDLILCSLLLPTSTLVIFLMGSSVSARSRWSIVKAVSGVCVLARGTRSDLNSGVSIHIFDKTKSQVSLHQANWDYDKFHYFLVLVLNHPNTILWLPQQQIQNMIAISRRTLKSYSMVHLNKPLFLVGESNITVEVNKPINLCKRCC